jgi:microsomal epoxide hydrolase
MNAPANPCRRKALVATFGLCAAAGVAQRARAGATTLERPSTIDVTNLTQTPAQIAKRQMATSDGVRLSLLECMPAAQRDVGALADPTVVLLPGWCMPASIWTAQLIGLGERWRTLAVDPRGQGESEIPPGGYTPDRRADDLHDVLSGRERVVLVAWSLGVLEALHYVHRHGSDRLLALALVDNSIGEPPAPKPSDFIEQLRRARSSTVERFVRSMFAHPLPESQVNHLRECALRMPLESSIALLSYPLPREHWRAVVHAFNRPLAYLITPRYREQAQHLLQARPASRVEVFEQAGHALFVDEALRFNRFLAAWIDNLSGQPLS